MNIPNPEENILSCLIVPKSTIGLKVSFPQEGRCYVNGEGELLLVVQSRKGRSHITVCSILHDGKLGEYRDIQYADNGYWSPSKGWVSGGPRTQLYDYQGKLSYTIRIEQTIETNKKIYENFVLETLK